MKRLGHPRFAAAAIAVLLTLTACGTTDTEQETAPVADTTSAPTDISWDSSRTRGIKIPVGGGYADKTDPIPHGWNDTPQAAVMAAITAQTFMATAGEDLWPQVSQLLLAPGPGRDQWAQARSLMDIDGDVPNPPQFVAFRFGEFSTTAAVVVLAADYGERGILGYPVQLTRADGEWRVVVPPQGQEPDLTPLSEDVLADFTFFDTDSKEN